MQIAPRLVGEALEKFPREAEAEDAGRILFLFSPRHTR